MLFETQLHLSLLLIFLIAGLLGGVIFDIGNFIKFLFANKKIACVIIDIFETLIAGCVFLYSNINFNYGLIRAFPVIIYFLSFALERFTLGKLVAKIYLSCYNALKVFGKKLIYFFKKFIKTKENGEITNDKK